jgi:four helix bundle protein
VSGVGAFGVDGVECDSRHSVWELAVFRKAYDAALDAHKLALTLPKYEQYDLASQIRRSSKSICANLVEGRGRQQGSRTEFKRFVIMALGSADESALWCKFARDLGYLSEDDFGRLESQFTEIARMLNGLAAKL